MAQLKRCSQLPTDSQDGTASQCFQDDRNFHLQYKHYDTSCLATASRIRRAGELSIVGNSDECSEVPSNRRQMETELLRKNECQNTEGLVTHAGTSTANRYTSAPSTESETDQDFRIHGIEIPTSRSPPHPMIVVPPYMDFQLANAARPVPLVHRQRPQPRFTGEISYGLPPLPLYDGSDEFRSASALALCSLRPVRSVAAQQPAEPYKCPVCLKCVRQRKPASTICGHVFCSSCIKTALRATCKCPVCQRMMTARQIFRIFL